MLTAVQHDDRKCLDTWTAALLKLARDEADRIHEHTH